MYRNTKIATCSYCGTRAALVLDAGKHELVCPSCGAQLHDLKAMPVRQDGADPKHSRSAPPPRQQRPSWEWDDDDGHRPKRRKRKSRKKKVKSFFEDAFDLIEDIFD